LQSFWSQIGKLDLIFNVVIVFFALGPLHPCIPTERHELRIVFGRTVSQEKTKENIKQTQSSTKKLKRPFKFTSYPKQDSKSAYLVHTKQRQRTQIEERRENISTDRK
jgi:hypothetical protein